MTKPLTGNVEAERNLKKNEISAPGRQGENDDRVHER